MEPLVIEGSRLQALIYGWIGIAAAFYLERFGAGYAVVAAVAGVVLGLFVWFRRIELDDRSVQARRLWQHRAANRSDVVAAFGHRYLTIEFPCGTRQRIEVPVEIRPEVRRWVDATSTLPDE